MTTENRIAVAYVDDRHLSALRKMDAARTREEVMSVLSSAETWIGPHWLTDLVRVLERQLKSAAQDRGSGPVGPMEKT